MHSEEFKRVLLPLWPLMFRFAQSLLGDRQEAEDCVQETFFKLWTRRESLHSIENLKAFSMQMIRNLCLDKIKARKRVMLDITQQVIEENFDLQSHIENKDLVVRVEEIIRQLPEQQRSLIHLRNVEGLEMKEIAEITGLSVEHTRVTLSRARIAIRELYQRYYGNERA
jgi:RNA polymerase sigma factor (sigma-70 family)